MLCGSSQARRPSTWQAVTVSSRRTSSSGRREHVEAAAHPRQRAPARAAGQPEQHRLGLVVEGVAEQHRRPRRGPGGDLLEHGVPRLPGGGLGTEPGGVDDHAWRSSSRRPRARPSARPRGPRGRPSRPGARGRRSPRSTRWSRLWPSKTAALSSASESAPPLQATTTVAPAGRSLEHGPHTAAYGGDRGVEAHSQDPGDPGVRVTDLGLARQVCGLGPDGVEVVHADLVDDVRARRRRRRGTAPSWRRGRAAGAGCGRGCRRPCGAR